MTINKIQFQTQGTCCALMNVLIENDIIQDVEFLGGCMGNLAGIRNLVKGMHIDSVIEKLQGIKCGSKNTSCPDQFSRCLLEYKKQNTSEFVK